MGATKRSRTSSTPVVLKKKKKERWTNRHNEMSRFPHVGERESERKKKGNPIRVQFFSDAVCSVVSRVPTISILRLPFACHLLRYKPSTCFCEFFDHSNSAVFFNPSHGVPEQLPTEEPSQPCDAWPAWTFARKGVFGKQTHTHTSPFVVTSTTLNGAGLAQLSCPASCFNSCRCAAI